MARWQTESSQGANCWWGTLIFLPAFGWLIPNHYPPWVSAWSDGVAIATLLALLGVLLLRSTPESVRVSWPLFGVATLCCAMLVIQALSGRGYFAGDALMAAFYVAIWFAAVVAGRSLCTEQNADNGCQALAFSWLSVAVVSIGIALVQWTEALDLGIYAAAMPPGSRPFANVAQPNNFCTLSFLGLCGVLGLYQTGRLGRVGFLFGASFLLLGMVLSQSRTGWGQFGLLLLLGLALRDRVGLRATRKQLLALAAVFALSSLLWPWVCDVLLLAPGRGLVEQMDAGVRVPYWWSMVDAILREPWFGYGWQQVGVAQQQVALDHPPTGALFLQSHNFVLDLLLWNGIPVGSLIVACLLYWGVSQLVFCRDAQACVLLVAVGGVFAHGLLEYPLEYAYFLIPVGLSMGMLEGRLARAGGPVVSRRLLIPFCGFLIATFLLVASEYLKAEEYYRAYRMESARIGFDRIVTPEPELKLLTQLSAFFRFSRTEARVGMSEEELEWMRQVSERFGYPSAMFRYALALGLNERVDAAQTVLDRLCRIHEKKRCEEAIEGWAVLQSKHPQLTEVKVQKVRYPD